MPKRLRDPAAVNCDPQSLAGNYFVSTYPPFSCWSAEQLPHLDRVLTQPATVGASRLPAPLGVYIHYPFCTQRCDYCYYRSYADVSGDRLQTYCDAVVRELEGYVPTAALADRRPDFVYFGGGTPSLMSTERIQDWMARLQQLLPWTGLQEATFECAPKSVSSSKMQLLRQVGITRISLGIQQLDDRVLAMNGRTHLTADVQRAMQIIRSTDFPVVNVDLMVGLVGETDRSFFESLDGVLALQPDSVTIYQLEIPRNTPLYKSLQAGTLPTLPAAWDVKRGRLAQAFQRLEEVGYRIQSAYTAARSSRTSGFLYQSAQYAGADLLGLGASSFSYLQGVHYQNSSSLDGYLAAMHAGRRPVQRAYRLSLEEQFVREFVLQLKLGCVDTERLQRKFSHPLPEHFAAVLQRLAEEGRVTYDSHIVHVTRSGLLDVDDWLASFYLPGHCQATYW